MKEAILDFAKQFGFEPTVVNEEKLKKASRFVVLGMGGSHIAGDIVKDLAPETPVCLHEDYDLPEISAKDAPETLFIASSYSGNTEEVLSGAREALSKKYDLACIGVGGALLDFAKKNNLPYIELPDTHIQPRMAVGFSTVALAKLMKNENLLQELHVLLKALEPAKLEAAGENLAKKIKDFTPVIYTSARNRSIAYNWKIKFNETGKVPAFYNLFPELNHNEMTGFDVVSSTKKLSQNFCFIFIKDSSDNPKINERMEICQGLYEKRGLKTTVLELSGASRAEKVFSSLILADWAAYHTAGIYGTEPEKVPMVEEFKKLIAETK